MISTNCDCYCILEGVVPLRPFPTECCHMFVRRQMKLQAGEIDFIYLAVNINGKAHTHTHTLAHTRTHTGSHNFCGYQGCQGFYLFNMHELVLSSEQTLNFHIYVHMRKKRKTERVWE